MLSRHRWLGWLSRGTSNARPLAGRPARRRRPMLEDLEGRALLSGWANTNGYLSSAVCSNGALYGLDSSGRIWIAQDGYGWVNANGYGVQITVGVDSQGRDELWDRTGGNQIWRYDNGSWMYTNGYLTAMAPGHGELFGIGAYGQVWYYRDGYGWINTSGYGAQVMGGGDPNGNDQIWDITSGGSVWSYDTGTYSGSSGGGSGGGGGITSTGLYSAYYCVIQDYATDLNGHVAYIQNEGPHNIYLSSIHAFSDAEGDNVAGNLSIISYAGDNISVQFVGSYYPDQHSLDIGNLSYSDGSPIGEVDFGIDFTVGSDGSLYTYHGSDNGGFYIYDNNNGFYDNSASDSSEWYISMQPNPNGLP
jgi:hypothetical protein